MPLAPKVLIINDGEQLSVPAPSVPLGKIPSGPLKSKGALGAAQDPKRTHSKGNKKTRQFYMLQILQGQKWNQLWHKRGGWPRSSEQSMEDETTGNWNPFISLSQSPKSNL